MHFRAAFVSASRAATRPPVANPVDLDLSGPGRKCPVEFGGEAPGADPARADLSVSLAPREQDVTPPSDDDSSEQQDVRRAVVGTAQSAFATIAAPSTVRTCKAALRAIASKVAAKLGP